MWCRIGFVRFGYCKEKLILQKILRRREKVAYRYAVAMYIISERDILSEIK